MRCARCHRELKKPGRTLRLHDGPIYFGSTCAREAGVTQRRKRTPKANDEDQRDSKTRDWINELGAQP